MFRLSQNACGACFRNGTCKGGACRVVFFCRRHYTENTFARHERRYRNRKRVFGYVGDGRKTTVVYLLLPAYRIEFYFFYRFRVFKIRNPRIVKCDMTVFAYSHKSYVNAHAVEQRAVPRRFFVGIRFTVD